MNNEQLLDALKSGIRAELDSVNLYQQALDASQDEEVRSFFQDRITEEKRHYNYLVKYFEDVEQNKKLIDVTKGIQNEDQHEKIFSDNFLERIGEKQTLFSAISTAVLLEKDALQYYKNLAQDVDDPELASFFNRMGHWETEHYLDVLHIQKQAEKYYWQQNSFEPF
jgi:rubrerythrin